MSAVAAAGLRGVADFAALNRRQIWIGGAVEDSDFPAELMGVVILRAGAIGAGVILGAGFRVEHMVNGRRGAVMKVGRCGPDAVERWGLIAVGFAGFSNFLRARHTLLAEPGALIMLLSL